MKKLVLPFLLLISTAASAQWAYDSITFEEPVHDLVLDPDTNNQWQIGKPNKTVFTNAISGNAAIVTDTVDTYVPGTKSVFVLDMIKYLTGDTVEWNEHQIAFTHAMDADSLHAGGYIEISEDSVNWYNIHDQQHLSDSLGIWNLFTSDNDSPTTLYNGQKGFTGHFNNQYYYLYYYYYIGKSANGMGWLIRRPYFRFVFESDSLATPADGWILDDFTLMIGNGGGVHENLAKHIQLYPNPAVNTLAITTDEKYFKPVSYRIANAEGKEVAVGKLNTNKLDVSALAQGSYIVALTDAKGIIVAKMFYKN